MSRKKHAVYALTPLPGWRPSSPWSFPHEASEARLVERFEKPTDATAFCRVHNRGQLQRSFERKSVEDWYVAVLNPRPYKGLKGLPAQSGDLLPSLPGPLDDPKGGAAA